MTEVLCDEYGLPLPVSTVPFHIAIQPGQTFQLWPQLTSLGYEPTGADPESILGLNGEKLQHFVRLLRENMHGLTEENQVPAIHLALNGNLGHLYGDAPGKILGALYGLQQVGAPHPIRVEDPIVKSKRQEQVEALKQLKQYIHLRRMSLQLVTGAWIDVPADVDAFLQAENGDPAIDMIHLQLARLGGIHDTMQAIAACRERSVAVLLEGEPAEFAVAVALAAQPDLLAAGQSMAAVQNEMTRILSWLRYKS
jgi:methylaspartate ammonia-lyase